MFIRVGVVPIFTSQERLREGAEYGPIRTILATNLSMMFSQLNKVVTRDQRKIANVHQSIRDRRLTNPCQTGKAGLDPKQKGRVNVAKIARRKIREKKIVFRLRRNGMLPLRSGSWGR